MNNSLSSLPIPKNEPIFDYAPGSDSRAALQAEVQRMRSEVLDIPNVIGGQEIRTNELVDCTPPHNHQHVIGRFHKANSVLVQKAVESALEAQKAWASMNWENRAAIFLRAAEMLSGPYRYKINAATMLSQGKNCYQAEIDAVCELIDFLRFNVKYMEEIYKVQPPENSAAIWNRSEYRPLEGFIAAVTPFNFTAIAGNLCAAPAMLGNVIVWKPSNTQAYSAHLLMEVFQKAGLPDGVINIVYGVEKEYSDVVLKHPKLAGVHFTGSTKTFQMLWKGVGENIENYHSYPRIVGETGGKDFVVAHPSAQAREVSTALIRGAFEYQGQKCSAASRAYIPKSLWPEVESLMKADLESIKVGPPEDFSNFVNAVIDRRSFDKIKSYIEFCRESSDGEIVFGGKCDDSVGYFVDPTVVLAKTPDFKTLKEEIFGPVLTVYVYEDDQFESTLDLVDQTSPYALTGSIFSQCRYAVEVALKKLENAAGNFYINDKPTGAVVGQQPFGGSRASGTNDKAGAAQNLMRWVNARSIKESLLPPTDYRYPFLG